MLSRPSIKRIYLLHFLTLGFYFFYWCAKSRGDINRSASQKLVPTTWLLALPAGNYWWMWKYSEAIEFVSFRRLKKSDTFLLYLISSHAWLLLTFGIQPTLNFDSSHVNHIFIVLIFCYIGFCILLQIAGAAFFCATMQRKVSQIIQTAQPNLAI